MSFKVCFICHDINSINHIINNNGSLDYSIIFVGDNELNATIANNNKVIIARNLTNNIEFNKQFLTFTAWYAIIKNNLFKEYKYIFVFEWDVYLKPNFIENVNSGINSDLDVISFGSNTYYLYKDINVDVFNYYLKLKGIDALLYNQYSYWLPSTNHGMKRDVLAKFVDWYYPSSLIIDTLNYANISWYHERLFFIYVDSNKLSWGLFSGMDHQQQNSHCSFNVRQDKLPFNLVHLYMNNDKCEYLNKLIEKYDIFNKVFQSCNHEFVNGCGSYLFEGKHYIYSDKMYEKQKLLFETAKKATNLLEIGVYLGHSLFIILLANPNIKITCIDIDDKYSFPSIQVLEKYFDTKITFIKNDCKLSLPNINTKFDFFHMDSLHEENHVLFEFTNTIKNIDETKNLIYYVFNDYECFPETIKKINSGVLISDYKPSSVNIPLCDWKNTLIEFIKCESELEQLAYKYGTDKLRHGFVSIYENHMNIFKNDIFNFLEIGVFFGSSIKMWSEYFKNATIYGADTFEGKQGNGNKFENADLFWNEITNSNDIKYDNIELVKLDQSNETQLKKFEKRMKQTNVKFKVIIDDGSHLMRDQQLSFFYLFDLLEDSGIYIIEDIHSSHEVGYDLSADYSNSTKVLFQKIKDGFMFDSVYINDNDKCRELTTKILDLQFYKIKDGSETLVIFKK